MTALPEADRRDEVGPSSTRLSPASDAGGDYFASDAHYSALAGRIIKRLREGPRFVLITGDPPPDPRRLASALTTASDGTHAVRIVTCGQEINGEELWTGAPLSEARVIVFEGADNLSDAQLGGFCEALAMGDSARAAAVLLARSSCVTRLERLHPRLLREGLASHFRQNELAGDEVETFIRHQLPRGEQPAFTTEVMSAIADFSGGDPATINRLSRVIADFAQSADGRQTKRPDDSASRTEEAPRPPLEVFASEHQPRHRRHRVAGQVVALFLCLGIAGFALMSLDRFGSLSSWLAPLHSLLSGRLADNEPTSEPGLRPMPAVPPEMAPRVPPVAEPVVEALEAEPITSPAAAPEIPAAEPKPAAPTPEMLEAPQTPPAPSPPMELQRPKSMAATPSKVELPSPPRPSAAEAAALVARGDALLSTSDFTSARLYYERAAEMGDGRGAARMGATFDRAFLARAGIRGTTGDEQEALSWYRRARDLGDAEADRLLKSLEPHHP